MRAFLNADGHTPALEFSALLALVTFVAALQLSIAVAQTLGVITLGCWVAWLSTSRKRPAAPMFFGGLLIYAALTLVSVVFSRDPSASLVDAKELLLFLVVPVVFQSIPLPNSGCPLRKYPLEWDGRGRPPSGLVFS